MKRYLLITLCMLLCLALPVSAQDFTEFPDTEFTGEEIQEITEGFDSEFTDFPEFFEPEITQEEAVPEVIPEAKFPVEIPVIEPEPAVVEDPQLAVLHEIYDAMTDTGKALSGWFAGGNDFCFWNGIRCEGNTITVLELKDAPFFCTFPDAILKLESLKELHLVDTMIYGTLPEELFSLQDLEVLELKGNCFTGDLTIRVEDAPFSKLRELTISDNLVTERKNQLVQTGNYFNTYCPSNAEIYPPVEPNPGLDGAFPENVVMIYGLQKLDLSGNAFTGQVPENLQFLPLNTLDLSDNAGLSIQQALSENLQSRGIACRFNGMNIIPEPTEVPTEIPTEEPAEIPEIPTEIPEIPTEIPVIPTDVPFVPDIPTDVPEKPTEDPEKEKHHGKPEHEDKPDKPEPIIIVVTATPEPTKKPKKYYTATPEPQHSHYDHEDGQRPNDYLYPLPPNYNPQPNYPYQNNPQGFYPQQDQNPYGQQGYQQPQYQQPVPTATFAPSDYGFTYSTMNLTADNIPMTWRDPGMVMYHMSFLDANGNTYQNAEAMQWTYASQLCSGSVCTTSVQGIPSELTNSGLFSIRLEGSDAYGNVHMGDAVMFRTEGQSEAQSPVEEPDEEPVEQQQSFLLRFFAWLFGPLIRLFGGE